MCGTQVPGLEPFSGLGCLLFSSTPEGKSAVPVDLGGMLRSAAALSAPLVWPLWERKAGAPLTLAGCLHHTVSALHSSPLCSWLGVLGAGLVLPVKPSMRLLFQEPSQRAVLSPPPVLPLKLCMRLLFQEPSCPVTSPGPASLIWGSALHGHSVCQLLPALHYPSAQPS